MHAIGILFGLAISDRIEQKQEWVENTRYNYCNFYQKPKCIKWTRETFDTPFGEGRFEGCQGWNCYR